MKSFIRTYSKKLSDAHKINDIERPKLRVDSKVPKSMDSVDSEIRSSWHNNESEIRRNNDLQPTTDMNNSAILTGSKESEWSYENYGFYSLPVRGYKKIRRSNIKIVINSDTVSQTKTLVYRDHQQASNTSFSNCTKNNDSNSSYSGSSTSLNSNDDPEIVAAIDQIASQMGLIESPVIKQLSDPVHYLLATRSFSERISIKRNSFENHFNKPRPQSLSNHSKPISPTAKLNVKENLPNGVFNQETNNKQSKISKFFQNISPKLNRRSKSVSCIDRNVTYSAKDNLRNKIFDENQKSIMKNEVSPQYVESIVSPEAVHFEYSNIIKSQCFNDNSKRLLNSLKVDRIEQPQTQFRTIYKRRIEEKSSNQVSAEIRKDLESINISENSKFEEEITVNYTSQGVPQRPVSANASYVNISLSAFGYGAHQSVYKSPIEKKPISFHKDHHNGSLI